MRKPEEFLDVETLLKHKPGNESEAHFLLKHAAQVWLWSSLGIRIIGMEIFGMWSALDDKSNRRNIIDVVGVGKRLNGRNRMWTSRGIEVKVSRSDFRSGYCRGADFTYIMAPQGVVPIEEIPAGVGLLEVDMEKLKIRIQPEIDVKGIKVTKRASFCMDSRFKDKKAHQKFMNTLIERIAYRNTLESIIMLPKKEDQ